MHALRAYFLLFFQEEGATEVPVDPLIGGKLDTKSVTSDLYSRRFQATDFKVVERKLELVEERLAQMEKMFSSFQKEIIPLLRQARSLSKLDRDEVD